MFTLRSSVRACALLALLVSLATVSAHAQDSRRNDAASPADPAAPVEGAPVEGAPVEGAPVEGAPAEAATTEAAPADAASTEASPAASASLEETAPAASALPVAVPVEAAPVEAAPVEATPVEAASSENATPAAASPAETAPAPQPPAYRGSLLYWQHGLTANTLAPDAQLTYNPTYYWYFLLQPRWYLDRQNFLVLSQGLSIEWTDADSTTTQREPQLGDTTFELRHTESLEGFVFIGSARLAAPVSTFSQAADRVLGTGLGLTVVRVFPELASLTFALSGSARHWFALTNVPTTNALSGAAGQFACASGTIASGGCDQIGDGTTERDRLTGGLTVSVSPIPELTFTTQYFMTTAYGHELAPAANPGLGGPTTLPDGSATHWRPAQYWAASVAYDVVGWLNLSIGYQSASSFTGLYNPNGSVRNPFYNADAELYLGANITFDTLIEDLVGAEEEGTPEERQRRRQGLSAAPSRTGNL